MRAGLLRHLVTLEAPQEGAPDALGAPPKAWKPVGQVYASVEPLNARELETARAVDGRVTHRVRIRYLPGLSTHWRIVLPRRHEAQDRILNIASVRNVDERDETLELLAVEAAA